MNKKAYSSARKAMAPFDRHFFTGKEKFTVIGSGSAGGKAQGLAAMKGILETKVGPQARPDFEVTIPTLTVIATECFDRFMKENDLYEKAFSEVRDDLLAHAFIKAELPVQVLGDLRALVAQVHTPLAIRSSSMLEDAMFEPFASVYATKMIPNNQHDIDARFHKLVEAVKYVYASTFFRGAKNYIQMTKHTTADEKMAVIIQEMVGVRRSDRFYPHISGVARSYNFYPLGHAKPEQGVVDLALGLGKSIVDDGVAWSYSPAYPKANPPYNSIGELLKQSQTKFWAVNMGKPLLFDPLKETEYMAQYGLKEAEMDGSLRFIASTYSPQDDRILMGMRAKGPRLIDFAPILKTNQIPLNGLVKRLLKACEEVLESMVEIEFAVTLDWNRGVPARFGFLQVRPMVVSHDEVEVPPDDLAGENVIAASENVLGNGVIRSIRDIVFVKPESFSAEITPLIPPVLEEINRCLVAGKRPYLLIGFGRWGTSDPQGGIPVNFGQISGAKVIVESTLPDMNFMLSQGSHFFHNITSFKICYFSIQHWENHRINWEWLNKQKAVTETQFVRHCGLPAPLLVKVDGRSGRGVICHE